MTRESHLLHNLCIADPLSDLQEPTLDRLDSPAS